jgi:hypothetical protein
MVDEIDTKSPERYISFFFSQVEKSFEIDKPLKRQLDELCRVKAAFISSNIGREFFS